MENKEIEKSSGVDSPNNLENSKKKKSSGIKIAILVVAGAVIASGSITGIYFIKKFFNNPQPEVIKGLATLSLKEVEGGYEVDGLKDENLLEVKQIDVPQEFNNKKIVSIKKGAFKGCANVEKITLPFLGANADAKYGDNALFGYVFGDEIYDGVATFTYHQYLKQSPTNDEDPFTYAKFAIPYSLSSVTITGGEYIAPGAFSNCKFLDTISINNNAKTIGDYAFYYCSALYNYSLPSSIIKIDQHAFDRCYTIKGIDIPNNVTEINDEAYARCINANYAKVPSSVKVMGKRVFTNINGIIIVDAKASDVEGKGWDVDWKDKDANVVYEANGGESLYIENFHVILCGSGDDKYLYLMQWLGDWGQITIDIPDTLEINGVNYPVREIGSNLFLENTNIQTLNLGKNVRKIHSGAFTGCTQLSSINFGDSLEYIGSDAFAGCTQLRYNVKNGIRYEGLIFPNTLKKIEDRAFYNCENVRSYNFGVDSKLEYIGESTFQNNLHLKGERMYVDYLSEERDTFIIPKTVSYIGNSAFKGSFKLDETTTTTTYPVIKIEDGNTTLSEIPDSCFEDCGIYSKTGIFSHQIRIDVLLGNCVSINRVGKAAFKNSFMSTLGEQDNCRGLTIIDDEAFRSSKLYVEGDDQTFYISPFVTYIGDYCFYGNPTLPKIEFYEPEIQREGGKVKIYSQLKTIGKYAFGSCTSPEFTQFRVPATVNEIGEYAFNGCSFLEKVEFENDPANERTSQLSELKRYTFSSCTKLGVNEKIVIPESVVIFRDNVFANCTNLKNVEIEGDVNRIESSLFINCSNLNTVWFKKNLNNATLVSTSIFNNCVNLETIKAGPFGDDALNFSGLINNYSSSSIFYICSKLKSIKLEGKGNMTLDSNTFYQCSSLESVNLINYARINEGCFNGCSSLTFVSTTNNSTKSLAGINYIGKNAFADCKKLGFTTETDIEKIKSEAFDLTTANLSGKSNHFGDTPFANWGKQQYIKITSSQMGIFTKYSNWNFSKIVESTVYKETTGKCGSTNVNFVVVD